VLLFDDENGSVDELQRIARSDLSLGRHKNVDPIFLLLPYPYNSSCSEAAPRSGMYHRSERSSIARATFSLNAFSRARVPASSSARAAVVTGNTRVIVGASAHTVRQKHHRAVFAREACGTTADSPGLRLRQQLPESTALENNLLGGRAP